MATEPAERPAALSAALRHQESVYRDVVLRRFPFEISLGMRLVYLRPYASPRVARLLVGTGHIEHASLKRATDTGLFMYELIDNGLDSDVGRTIVGRLNQMHGRWPIRQEDYRWILATFIVLPTQAVDRYAWRRLTDEERQATMDWYRELGHRMGIHEIPSTYEEAEQDLRDYEQRNLRPSEAGQRLMTASWAAGLQTLPAAVRPLASRGIAVMTDEPARSALGLPKPSALTAAAVRGALLAHGVANRNKQQVSQFEAKEPLEAYPDWYTLDDLGVTTGRHANLE